MTNVISLIYYARLKQNDICLDTKMKFNCQHYNFIDKLSGIHTYVPCDQMIDRIIEQSIFQNLLMVVRDKSRND